MKTKLLAHTGATRGVIIGLLGGVLLLIFGGICLWGLRIAETPTPFTPPQNNELETPRADADIQILKTVSGSDEILSIQADLNSTNMDSLDKELDLIDQDLHVE